MKELIIKVLKELHSEIKSQLPKEKTKVESLSIREVQPMFLRRFMSENGIPETAYFDGRDNGHDAWDDILISWDIKVPTTEYDKEATMKRRFNSFAFIRVQETLLKNNYVRAHFPMPDSQFKFITEYDMYVKEEYDRLVQYYSPAFKIKIWKE
mgnify:CR=1 FL=1